LGLDGEYHRDRHGACLRERNRGGRFLSLPTADRDFMTIAAAASGGGFFCGCPRSVHPSDCHHRPRAGDLDRKNATPFRIGMAGTSPAMTS
jgi:hypothetical protein